jgi:urease accessory protein UreF
VGAERQTFAFDRVTNNLPAVFAYRSAKRFDIADQVIDFRARQREVRHHAVRMGEKSAQLIRSLAAVGNRGEAGRALCHPAARMVLDYMAIGAPLPRELSSPGDIGAGRMPANRSKRGQYQHSS